MSERDLKPDNVFSEDEYRADAGRVIAHAIETGRAEVRRADGSTRVVISIPGHSCTSCSSPTTPDRPICAVCVWRAAKYVDERGTYVRKTRKRR